MPPAGKSNAMSRQKATLLEIAHALSSGGEHRIAAWFTEDFRLHDPSHPGFPSGHDGARKMLEGTLRLGPNLKIAALDMVEEADRVMVRWRFSAPRDGEALDWAVMSMYRFDNGRIAEDWGVHCPRPWP